MVDIPEMPAAPETTDTPDTTAMPKLTATPDTPDMLDTTKEMLQRRNKRLTAMVAMLQGERDRAFEESAICRAERDQMAAMLVQTETNAAEALDTAGLSPESTVNELSQELDDCRRALEETKAELERTKEDLARAEFRLRGQTAKLRRQSDQPQEKIGKDSPRFSQRL
jgi:chromosome segregation ATPase